MRVEELIRKLKKMPQKAHVCWDSNKLQYWFGEEITKEIIYSDDPYCEDGEPDGVFGKNGKARVVRLS